LAAVDAVVNDDRSDVDVLEKIDLPERIIVGARGRGERAQVAVVSACRDQARVEVGRLPGRTEKRLVCACGSGDLDLLDADGVRSGVVADPAVVELDRDGPATRREEELREVRGGWTGDELEP